MKRLTCRGCYWEEKCQEEGRTKACEDYSPLDISDGEIESLVERGRYFYRLAYREYLDENEN